MWVSWVLLLPTRGVVCGVHSIMLTQNYQSLALSQLCA
jgi:hypothetical protein